MEELFSQISNFGFPMALSIYLLTRLESKLDNLSSSIRQLSTSVDKIGNKQ